MTEPHDPSPELTNWIHCAEDAARILSAKFDISPDEIDMQAALMFALKLDHSTDLLSFEWSVDKMLTLTKDIDFKAWCQFEEIRLAESALPADFPGRLDEETVRSKGEKWRIHRYDPDDFLPVPHAHNLQSGLKLDLRNGNLYKKHECVGHITRRDLLRIRNMVTQMDLPPITV